MIMPYYRQIGKYPLQIYLRIFPLKLTSMTVDRTGMFAPITADTYCCTTTRTVAGGTLTLHHYGERGHVCAADPSADGTGSANWWVTDPAVVLATEHMRASLREREVWLVDS